MCRGTLSAALCFAVFLSPQQMAAQSQPLAILDVPFLLQDENLCGGAAAAMVLRYWGERGISSDDFAFLVDARASGIRGDVLAAEVRRRGWTALAFRGDDRSAKQHLEPGTPAASRSSKTGQAACTTWVLLAWAEGQVVLHDPARAPFEWLRRPHS